MNTLKIGFIGGGKIAQAMAKGIIAAGKRNPYITQIPYLQILR